MYAISVTSTVLGVAALTVMRRLEHKEDNILRLRVTLVLDEAAPSLEEILRSLDQKGITVAPAEYERHVAERRVQLTFLARLPESKSRDLVITLESQLGVSRVRVEPVT